MLGIVATENLIPQDATEKEQFYVREKYPRQDVLFSADVARYVVQNALPGSKVRVWEPKRWSGNILAYLSVPTEVAYFSAPPPPVEFRLINPVPSIPFRVTSAFNTPRDYANFKHEGLDLDAYDDVLEQVVDVVSAADGVVEVVNTIYNPPPSKNYGIYVVIKHTHGSQVYKTWYCHLSSIAVIVGQHVSAGTKIGVAGATGTSAIHLHLNLQKIGGGLSGYFEPDVVDPFPYIDHDDAPPPVPIPVDTYFGLGAGTQDEIPQSHADVYGLAFGNDDRAAFKFLTLPDGGAMTRSITRIKAKNPQAFLMARIFFGVGNTPFTPQDFVDYSHNGTAAAYANGIRDYEVHNEQGLVSEGLGLGWNNGVEFGNWLKAVIAILRPRYPDARFWMPALSPNSSAPQFFLDTASTGVGSLVYGYCYHNYFYTESGGTWNMVDESGGLQHLKLRRLLSASEQAKPTSITEFSCNTFSVSPRDKGGMYKRYRELLIQNGVHSAFSFVLNWSDDRNLENWANANGGSTGIAEGYRLG